MTDEDFNPEDLKSRERLQATIDRLIQDLETAVGDETLADSERRVRILTGCFKLQDVLNEKAKSETLGTHEPTSFLNMTPPNDEEIAFMRAELIRRYDRLAAEAATQPTDQ